MVLLPNQKLNKDNCTAGHKFIPFVSESISIYIKKRIITDCHHHIWNSVFINWCFAFSETITYINGLPRKNCSRSLVEAWKYGCWTQCSRTNSVPLILTPIGVLLWSSPFNTPMLTRNTSLKSDAFGKHKPYALAKRSSAYSQAAAKASLRSRVTARDILKKRSQ